MTYEDVVGEVAETLGIEKSVVHKSYKYFWKFIRDKIRELPLKEIESKEEFDKLRTSFNVPSLGKFHCSYDRIMRIKESYLNRKNLIDEDDGETIEDKTDV